MLIAQLKEDIKVNAGNPKGKTIVVCYRIASYIHARKQKNLLIKILGYPIVKIYRAVFMWFMGVEIPDSVKIGTGLQVWHGMGLVINAGTVIGNNALLRHTTTIGNKNIHSGCPVIGNNVHIGAHSIIIGDITIGDNVIIGAGTIVTKSIPANCTAYGNPVKIIANTNA
ncbi:serine O-acetyltransferase [Mucilaginibacter glaciei]|uniref:Serine acetyltransferase n=1 Tax=Mucilaginibacter glaciei TaxID=2772109 RepID=A0A926NP46_9SPHI|nr:DapH/DapD/GlmU-related protein [Mucilaginibacter glaciei]MBD1393331.1 serine acetyltransferase [Mucilaginibacter glaciei]